MLTRTRHGIFVVECDVCLRRLVLGEVTRTVAEEDLHGAAWAREKTPHNRTAEQDHWRCPQCVVPR